MKRKIKFKIHVAILLSLYVILVFAGTGLAKVRTRKPKARNPARYSFPALGITAERKVQVAWNRFYDHAGLGAILARIHKAFPELTRLYSIGKSTERRDIWGLEVTALNVGDPDRKPGMYIDGNIHGNEVQTGETVAYTAWYICHQYGKLEKVTALLEGRYNVSLEDIREVAKPALRHRLILNLRGEAEGIDADDVIGDILEGIPEKGHS